MRDDFDGLPGAERLERGVRDLRLGRHSPEALLVASAVTRLRGLGVEIPAGAALPEAPELGLYAALGGECDDPYFRYNALRRELDSFVAALEARRARRARPPVVPVSEESPLTDRIVTASTPDEVVDRNGR